MFASIVPILSKIVVVTNFQQSSCGALMLLLQEHLSHWVVCLLEVKSGVSGYQSYVGIYLGGPSSGI